MSHDILTYENYATPVIISSGNGYKSRKAWGQLIDQRPATSEEETSISTGKSKYALAAAATYYRSDFRLKTDAEKEGSKKSSRSGSKKSSGSKRSSKGTPSSREGKSNPNDLSDAEIEQRREAARKSAEARRKTQTDAHRAEIKNMTLAQKVNLAANLERGALDLREKLESELRATSDKGRRAEIRGELDDIKDMLSAKDDWVKRERGEALDKIDSEISQVKLEADKIKMALSAEISTLQSQYQSAALQIQFADSAVEKIELRNQADDLRQQTLDARAALDNATNRASNRTNQLRTERQRKVEAYRLATEQLRLGRRRSSEYFL